MCDNFLDRVICYHNSSLVFKKKETDTDRKEEFQDKYFQIHWLKFCKQCLNYSSAIDFNYRFLLITQSSHMAFVSDVPLAREYMQKFLLFIYLKKKKEKRKLHESP